MILIAAILLGMAISAIRDAGNVDAALITALIGGMVLGGWLMLPEEE